ncbi:enoyl CoA hydratase/isomerase (crotonase) [Legionella birminghamensis]|uniref:Enoyl CoA hydratase/isomerase (Crotonase) n=1 Tax=Legionella birminghamensis TaxID=28083 RepID=A0A378IBU0_9GAMM|nr:enoyl-CoA hydratase-related protein [Legionella birminghamensis]KTC73047.1 enoyl CoA hydratase/isomerase (crotonase) [Legionella birminghamensis]STX32376.1 enoyl CoA hydratase/isomerase (crotonase) [Legionella birminghamensis]
MSDLQCELKGRVFEISLNRIDKNNAFDDDLLKKMQTSLDESIQDPAVSVILLRANGRHFSAGADLQWMQRMAAFSQEENLADAMVLARLMHTLYSCPKPTVAVVQGAAYGGGAGLVAACDIAIAGHSARFCFSEVKLGLVPAVISPYVVRAIGERLTKWLFMSAEVFNGEQAKQYNLVHHYIDDYLLDSFALDYASKLSHLAPKAVVDCKPLIDWVASRTIDQQLIQETAAIIAEKRVSEEGQRGLHAFLNKESPNWN